MLRRRFLAMLGALPLAGLAKARPVAGRRYFVKEPDGFPEVPATGSFYPRFPAHVATLYQAGFFAEADLAALDQMLPPEPRP